MDIEDSYTNREYVSEKDKPQGEERVRQENPLVLELGSDQEGARDVDT